MWFRRDDSASEHDASTGRRTAWMLIVIAMASVALLIYDVRSRDVRRGDTRLVSGTHVVFAFIAPTSTPTDSFVAAINALHSATRDSAKSAGHHFSSIGVSDDWIVERGLEMLSRFDAFDELDVGRNAFNLGIRRFIFDQQAERVVPQVVIMVEEVDRRSPDLFVAAHLAERLLGSREILAWRSRPLSFRAAP